MSRASVSAENGGYRALGSGELAVYGAEIISVNEENISGIKGKDEIFLYNVKSGDIIKINGGTTK